MKKLSVRELVKDAPALVSMIKDGEEVQLTENGQELARVVPIASTHRSPRPSGLAQGEFTVPKDFNAPLPDNVLREFEGA